MPYRIAVQFAVSGDLRFLSHQDSMKLFERAAVRARLPLRWGQGFNPHPHLSLPLPRPVGVASEDELLVLELAEDQPVSRAVLGPGEGQDAETREGNSTGREGEEANAATAEGGCATLPRVSPAEVLDRLAGQMPAGIRLLSARDVPAVPQPRSVRYSVELGDDSPADLAARIDGVLAVSEIVVRRRVDEQGTDRPVDIRPYIESLRWDPQVGRLEWTLQVTPTGSARPGEVLGALGLDPAAWVHRVTREHVDWQ